MSHALPVHAAPRSDINTTPLVDVMLVLLIIFMITAPLLSHRIDIKLPAPGPNIESVAPTQIALRMVDGQVSLLLDQQPIDLQGLRAELSATGRIDPKTQTRYQLVADDAVPYARVTELMAMAQAMGLQGLTLGELNPR
jgi:biopolymer transport protein ExbD